MSLMIRPPRPAELAAVQQVEVAAGRLFADVDMELVAQHEPFSRFELQGFLDRGSFWVATPGRGRPPPPGPAGGPGPASPTPPRVGPRRVGCRRSR